MAERSRHAGFTLIEVLAVVVIIAIGTAVALISVKAIGGRSDQAQAAERLAGLIQLASENARMENIQYGLKIKPHRYQFLIFNGRGQWLPVTKDPVLTGRSVPDGMKLKVSTESEVKIPVASTAPGAVSTDAAENAPDASTALVPQIAILSTGEITPFTLRLISVGGKTYVLRSTGNDRIHVVPPASVNGPNAIYYQN